jgi:hypothetical protein
LTMVVTADSLVFTSSDAIVQSPKENPN